MDTRELLELETSYGHLLNLAGHIEISGFDGTFHGKLINNPMIKVNLLANKDNTEKGIDGKRCSYLRFTLNSQTICLFKNGIWQVFPEKDSWIYCEAIINSLLSLDERKVSMQVLYDEWSKNSKKATKDDFIL